MNRLFFSSRLQALRALRHAAVAALLLPAALTPAFAHKASDAYLRLEVQGDTLLQRTDIALRDLDRDLVLDADDNGELSWGEVRAQWPLIEQLAEAGIALQADGQPCQPGPAGAAQLDSHSDGRYAVLTRRWICPAPVRELSVGYTLFAASDPTHRGILNVTGSAGSRTAVLVPGAAPQRFGPSGAGGQGGTGDAAGEPARVSSFAGFIAEGVHHILIGTDHVLFLLALLLPGVLVPGLRKPPRGGRPAGGRDTLAAARMGHSTTARSALAMPAPALSWNVAATVDSAWRAAPRFSPVAADVAKVVTAFTVAHSLTLALAVLGLVNPPSRVVESIIAATVALTAIDNLWPFLPRQRWKLTFVFGLVHGFGFASALQDLGLARESLASSLLGFNLGVELGQLGIVALFLPLAWWSRGSLFYRRVVLGGGSAAIAVMALLWLAERALDLKIVG